MFQWKSFFLATLSYLKIIGRSYVFFRSPVERSFKNPFQCPSIRLQSSCQSAAALCFFLKYFCGNLQKEVRLRSIINGVDNSSSDVNTHEWWDKGGMFQFTFCLQHKLDVFLVYVCLKISCSDISSCISLTTSDSV